MAFGVGGGGGGVGAVGNKNEFLTHLGGRICGDCGGEGNMLPNVLSLMKVFPGFGSGCSLGVKISENSPIGELSHNTPPGGEKLCHRTKIF